MVSVCVGGICWRGGIKDSLLEELALVEAMCQQGQQTAASVCISSILYVRCMFGPTVSEV